MAHTEGLRSEKDMQENSLRTASLFGSNMILQRRQPVTVWGESAPGDTVRVEMLDQQVSVVANGDGKWKAVLQPLEAGGPYTMTVSSNSGQQLIYEHVKVGEVWLFIGQSNLNRSLGDAAIEEANASYADGIRQFRARMPAGANNMENEHDHIWTGLQESRARHFSRVAFYTAKAIYEKEQVPVGIVLLSCGDTRIESFVDPNLLPHYPELENISRSPENSYPNHRIGAFYSESLRYLAPYAIQGVVWYQGESNNKLSDGPGSALLYKSLLHALIRTLRRDWNQPQLPFMIVQLPNYINKWGSFPHVRQAQLEAVREIAHTGLAVTIDVGDPDDLHPFDKRPVGQRLGYWILGTVYGYRDIVISGPLIREICKLGSRVVLSFDHIGSGFMIKGDKLTGFELSDALNPQQFYEAEAVIAGDTITVSSSSVAAPAVVQYAWADNPAVSLYNREGLPASPFRMKI